MKRTTLCYPIMNGKVLLAMKKRGFGTGKWNGPGGKRCEGESAEDASRRETREEVNISVGAIEHRGVIFFRFPDHPDWDNACDIFVTSDIRGVPEESDEMRPAWFALDELPLEDMWPDDAVWLPGVLRGGTVHAEFVFDADGNILRWEYLPKK
ncbi:8-oxo-dGTP diphosphatase [Patescibacteria group bacterium]|jgi:8-oxo-dGTP pyrophosphatase MutT (NUDIX family)|uniref:Oxidized purine nucleoside triphosphate hydrolase n=1 Tax=candidate division WWE3 bacterium TaxID=2053526 RepID=A0A928Y6Q7_UNCKA|nr:8-oxo-dGTP diphosphatase [candidate division WWE3 bacterium]MCL4732344.1 8-oxo-dGTP diphosphatase [Patescibacteria group bacterium]MDL1952769.1 8-oxo-dGTP diphosphatase [Candidatus Uhrbacteria bacterium UHB]RIL01005.1 MAG: hypothetical protein DCC77_00490 [Candidatus Uhrbacteria bacterium]